MSVLPLTKDLIPADDPNWGKTMNAYNQEKKVLKWGSNPMPYYISEKMVKAHNNQFNPVTQEYTNKEMNTKIKDEEKKTLVHSLSQYYDNSLRNKQTFDIINLKDHLKGFEDHPDYPNPKYDILPKKKLKEQSNVCYNIISNIGLNEHSPYPPELRPKINPSDLDYGESNRMSKPIKLNTFSYKDYNIISNRYKEFHDDKTNIDHQINELTASKKIQERPEYDFVNCQYYNKDLQKKHDAQANQQKKILMQPQLYNPVNNAVIDDERVKAYDLLQNNKKLRYQAKQQVEDYYRSKALENDLREENSIKAHHDYYPYKQIDKRGYNFMTNERNYGHYKHQFRYKNDRSTWELLRDNASENETFSKKGIFKPQYDKTDQEDNLYNFNKKREDIIKGLPQLQNDENFRRSMSLKKISDNQRNEIDQCNLNKLAMSSVVGNVFIDKKDWFDNKKTLNADQLQTGIYRFKKTKGGYN